jgi:hypothetical protein
MELVQLFEHLKGASPILILAIATVWIVNRVLAFLADKSKSTFESSVTAGLAGLTKALDGHIQEEMSRTVTMIETLKSIEGQLVMANNTGKLSRRNQRLMLEYQWAWCRDSTADIICESVRRNNIAGNEALVTRRVNAAFRKARDEALDSLEKLEGLSYDYAGLFLEAVPLLWEQLMEWAVPLYHRDLNGASLDDALADLRLRIKDGFDAQLKQFLADADGNPESSSFNRSAGRTRSGEFDATAHQFAEKLQSYKPGSGGYAALSRKVPA